MLSSAWRERDNARSRQDVSLASKYSCYLLLPSINVADRSYRIRRVKCDEGKPDCDRCVSGGWKCNGYLPWVAVLPGPESRQAPKQVISESESRALDFFRQVVAPAVGGYVRSEFWTLFVLQASPQEPAVRHAVAAVSALYEDFDGATVRNAFALQQYNRSINRLRQTSDPAIVLIVCILMICIEFLQGNVEAALAHCRHGIAILNGPGISRSARDNLLSLFCRLCIVPSLYGSPQLAIPLVDRTDLHHLRRHASVDQLQNSFDLLSSPCTALIHRARPFYSLVDDAAKADILATQHQLLQDLDQWHVNLQAFRKGRTLTRKDTITCYIMEMRYVLSVVNVGNALETDEFSWDRHLPWFQRMAELATLVLAESVGLGPPPKFLFEMGFLSLLCFVVVKCRCLCTRVATLYAMRALAVGRETVWDFDVMYAVCQQVIKREHNVHVEAFPLRPAASADTAAKAAMAMRGARMQASSDGRQAKRVSFSVDGPWEWTAL